MANNGGHGGKPVGYGSPPTSGQFKKGELSRNPAGRPRNPHTTEEALAKLLNRKVSMMVDGRRKRVPLREALTFKVVQGALNGEPKDAFAIVKLSKEWEEKDHARKLAAKPEETPPESDEQRRFAAVMLDLYEIAQGLMELGALIFTEKSEVRVTAWLFELLKNRSPEFAQRPAVEKLQQTYVTDQIESSLRLTLL